MNTDPRDVIVQPVVSEKSYALAETGKYTFRVAPKSNKVEIRRAVEAQFNVTVTQVNTCWVRGKKRRLGRMPEGRTKTWKKAVVTLAPGDSIPIFEAG